MRVIVNRVVVSGNKTYRLKIGEPVPDMPEELVKKLVDARILRLDETDEPVKEQVIKAKKSKRTKTKVVEERKEEDLDGRSNASEEGLFAWSERSPIDSAE